MDEATEESRAQMTSSCSSLGLVLKEGRLPPDKDEMPQTPRADVRWYQRQDLWVWLYGMVFIGGLIGAIFGIGSYRGWYAPVGFAYNVTNTTRQRFLPEPYVLEPGVKGRQHPGSDGRWYFWKLRPELVTPWTQLFVWGCYTVHQLLAWWLLYLAQVNQQSQKGKKYSPRLSKYNWAAVAVHTFFHLMHLAQTHVTYDATAQDVTIGSSQGSVIVALLFVMIIEFRDRGVFFGWPNVKSTDKIGKAMRSWSRESVSLIRKYHGYLIMWAAVYTFWYHPMENTLGHVMGFFHTWILMLQGSLFYTDLHLNRYWRFTLEVWVTLHGGLVAWQTGGPDQMGTKLWPMFTFGFATLIVLTQIFTLPFWRHLPAWSRGVPALLYLGVLLYCYSWIPDENGRPWTRLREPFLIPLNQYLFPLVICGLVTFGLYVERKVANGKGGRSLSDLGRVGYLVASLCMYVIIVVLSWSLQYYDAPIPGPAMMFVHVPVFIIFAVVSAFLVKRVVEAPGEKVKVCPNTESGEIPGKGIPGTFYGQVSVIELEQGQLQLKESALK
ncbi:PREDICTED: uncharacterized protein LOC109461615 [Branchiostoma belcheri]|uniref:Uncharacterized protein LOC109461615 n=1 Tax=Branchiostoma belcheri TaxID=7741 RepID=A0A6P4Y4E4_BRABE|nr:PREDICTED: uncharacterized protein LOC109461615 [Branchiostoma belcheri]